MNRERIEAAKTWVLLLALAAATFVAVVFATLWLRAPSARPATSAVAPAPPKADAAGAHSVASDQIAQMIDKLAARLQQQPQDPDGWAMLARSYAVSGRHAEAVPAFRQAVAQRANDPVLLADFADALAVTQGRSFAGEPQTLVDKALQIDPNSVKALSLAGSAAFERKDFAGAVRHWEQVVRVAPPDSPFVPLAQSGMAQARAASGR